MKKEDGDALILVTLPNAGLLSITGLIIDGGTLYMTKSHLQKTANAAVLSGAQELPNTEANVKSVVEKVISEHAEEDSLKTLTVNIENRVQVELEKRSYLHFQNYLVGILQT
ncbi:Tad domain-containing protein [Anaerobacillus sp. HL2]|nr:Tad domain-containing protein [Anaerobacillus sp. HL2]